MPKRLFIRLAMAAGLALFAPTGHAAQTQRVTQRVIAIGTGGPTGVYFVVGNAICRMLRKERAKGRKHGLHCVAPTTSGSIYNLKKVGKGALQFGLAQSDWQHHAVKGTSKFAGRAIGKLRAVFSLHHEPLQIVVSKASGIRSWADLKGRRVNIGNRQSGHRATMEVLLQAHGLDASYFSKATEYNSSEQSSLLCQGDIDAFGYAVGVPNAGVAQATDGCGASIISLQTPAVAKLIAGNEYYTLAKIPKHTYATTDQEVTTFGVIATLVTSADIDADIVYELTRAVFENLDEVRKLYPALGALDRKKMVIGGLSAELHKGARRYYREKGLLP